MSKHILHENYKRYFGPITEEVYKNNGEVMNGFFKDDITLGQLIDFANAQGKPIATVEELDGFLENDVMASVMADSTGVEKSILLTKVKELRDYLSKMEK